MKRIKVFGDLASFGDEFILDVKTPGEAIRAIEANRPGFMAKADGGKEGYALVLMSDDPDSVRQVTLKNANDLWGDEVLLIAPILSGNVPVVFVAGVLAVSATSVTAIVVTAIVNIVISMAISLAVSAISSLISGTNSGTSTESLTKASYLFNGVVNTSKQGVRIPLLYGGPLLVGSMVLSFSIDTGNI